MSSPSSITTSIPTGAIPEWCLELANPHAGLFSANCPEVFHNRSTVPPKQYQAFCCDGDIVDLTIDIYNLSSNPSPILPGSHPGDDGFHPVDLSNLVCCGATGTQTAALGHTPSVRTTCAPGTTATPLASLAATNMSHASTYPLTWSSPSPTSAPDSTVTNDLWGWNVPKYGASGTPVCFLANTGSGVSMAEVTVPATYVAPTLPADSGSGSSPTAPSSAARTPRGGRLHVALRLIAIALLFV
ncbi:hypothetical protein GGS26DRAFT_96072 [Hypomontagnella submonticulosa]|nr:hypothetical protein GGS26DRAFT_96072 [Hypomontagnella submonticulosa]